jgi:diguanylate cyclase (GGDEF)-like protein
MLFMLPTLDPASTNLTCAAFLALAAAAVFVLRGSSERVASLELASLALLLASIGIALQAFTNHISLGNISIIGLPCLVASIVLISAAQRAANHTKDNFGAMLGAFGLGSLAITLLSGAARELCFIAMLFVVAARWLETQFSQNANNAAAKQIRNINLITLALFVVYLLLQGSRQFNQLDEAKISVVHRFDLAIGLCSCALLIVWAVQSSHRSEVLRRVQLDPLTGLASRDYLLQNAERWMKDHPLNLALMVVDIDHFRTINERYGHEVGDSVLRHVGKRIKESVRKDTLVARYGGEEFGLIVPVADNLEAAKVAERLRFEIEQAPFFLGAEAITLTVSIGLTRYDQSIGLRKALLDADGHLHSAKGSGRNRVVSA